MNKAPVLSYDEIDSLLDQFNPAIREHDGMTFAIEIANAQRDADHKYYQDKIRGALLTEEERDNCTPTDEQLESYLAEPDDEVARKLRSECPEMFRITGRCILYGRNIAQAQIQKILDS